MHILAALVLGPAAPRRAHRAHRRARPAAAASTCCSPPTSGAKVGFLLAVAGLVRLAVPPQPRVAGLRHRLQGRARRPGWSRRSSPATWSPTRRPRPSSGSPASPRPRSPTGGRFLPPGNSILAPGAPRRRQGPDPARARGHAGAARSRRRSPPRRTTCDDRRLEQGRPQLPGQPVRLQGVLADPPPPDFIKHQPHYLVIRVQPSLPSVTLAGAAATLPAADLEAGHQRGDAPRRRVAAAATDRARHRPR